MWDLRTYKEVHAYFTRTPPTDMDISERGLLSLGAGCHVQVHESSVGSSNVFCVFPVFRFW